jgi:hypothetical protein
MSKTDIAVGMIVGYLAIGGLLSLLVGFEDLKKRRVSLVGFIADLAELFSPFLVLYLLLWPFWYFSWRSRDKKDRQLVVIAYGPDRAKYPKKEPIQPPETTRGK